MKKKIWEEGKEMSQSIKVETHGTWVEVTLNRPDRLNSFNDEMHARLRKALKDAESARAVLITGAGRGFCAGQDLGDRDPSKMGGPPDLGHTLETFYHPLIRQIRSLKMPVVCAVNGVAAGAGANLALNCDIVLAGHSAKFIQSFSKVGLVPDAGGGHILPRLIGLARAKAIALTAHPVDAKTAESWGMIWKAIPDEDLMSEARDLTHKLASGPTFGLSHTKRLMDEGEHLDFEAFLKREASVQKACGESADYAEGVSAFLGKRQAEFKGRQ